MDKYVITLGDFLKNAGIVGFRYMLEAADAKEDSDFGITQDGQGLWIDMDFALNADWTDMYFKACVQYFGPFTVYQGVLDRISKCIDKIQIGKWNPGKEEKEDLKFINDKLLSNSYQAGFENIKHDIEMQEVYQILKKDKLNDKLDVTDLEKRLIDLEKFLQQPKCRETFIMKSVIWEWIVIAVLYAVYLTDFIVTVAVIQGLNKKLTRLDKVRSDLRIVSDKLSDTLATTTIGTAQKVGEGKVQATLAAAELRDATAAQREKSIEMLRIKRAELQAQFEELSSSITNHTVVGQGRIIKAFPKMQHRDYSELIQELKKRLK